MKIKHEFSLNVTFLFCTKKEFTEHYLQSNW